MYTFVGQVGPIPTLELDLNFATPITIGSTPITLGATATTIAGLTLAGLTVNTAAFISRGITDNATTTAITISGSGANSITIANSATNPTIGTTAGSLNISSIAAFSYPDSTYQVLLSGTTLGIRFYTTAGGSIIEGVDKTGTLSYQPLFIGGSQISFTTSGSSPQVVITPTAGANRYITLTGSNGANPAITTSAGNLSINGGSNIISSASYFTTTLGVQSWTGTATPAGGAGAVAFTLGSAAVGIYFGSGVPTVSAAQGSIYLRTDGGASTRIYSNNNGSTGWSAITSA